MPGFPLAPRSPSQPAFRPFIGVLIVFILCMMELTAAIQLMCPCVRFRNPLAFHTQVAVPDFWAAPALANLPLHALLHFTYTCIQSCAGIPVCVFSGPQRRPNRSQRNLCSAFITPCVFPSYSPAPRSRPNPPCESASLSTSARRACKSAMRAVSGPACFCELAVVA